MRFPDVEALAGVPLHVLLRDFPEALGVCRRFGIDAAQSGGQPLVTAAGERMAELHAALRQAAVWREGVRPGACEQAAAGAASVRSAARAVPGASPGA